MHWCCCLLSEGPTSEEPAFGNFHIIMPDRGWHDTAERRPGCDRARNAVKSLGEGSLEGSRGRPRSATGIMLLPCVYRRCATADASERTRKSRLAARGLGRSPPFGDTCGGGEGSGTSASTQALGQFAGRWYGAASACASATAIPLVDHWRRVQKAGKIHHPSHCCAGARPNQLYSRRHDTTPAWRQRLDRRAITGTHCHGEATAVLDGGGDNQSTYDTGSSVPAGVDNTAMLHCTPRIPCGYLAVGMLPRREADPPGFAAMSNARDIAARCRGRAPILSATTVSPTLPTERGGEPPAADVEGPFEPEACRQLFDVE